MVATKGAGFAPIDPIAPVKPSLSILSVSRTLVGEWRSGVTWRQGLPCGDGEEGPGFRRAYCGSGDFETAADGVKPEFYPYDIYVPYDCDWVVEGDEAQYNESARLALDAVTAWHVSRELWLGDTEALNPSLVSEATDESANAPVHPVTAVGSLLEAWTGCTQMSGDGRRGPVIHAPAFAVTSLLANFTIRQEGDVYIGPMGSLLSPGPGYPTGTGARPAGASDGDEDGWIYISGPVEVGLGDIRIDPDSNAAHRDRRGNQYRIWAQRQAIHRFDPCCVFAIAVYQPSPTDSQGV